MRRTLDQSHYYVLSSTEQRDQDQVVLRGAERGYLSNPSPHQGPNELDGDSQSGQPEMHFNKAECNMVMVDQLWLWIFNSNKPVSLTSLNRLNSPLYRNYCHIFSTQMDRARR